MTTDGGPEVQISGEARLSHDGWVSEFEAFRSSAEARKGGALLPAVPGSARSRRSGHSAAAWGRSSATNNPAAADGGGGDPRKAMDDLHAEIKLLHWHKLANEAALKAALLKTKKIKAEGGGNARPVPATTTLAMPIEERATWMQQIIEEEQSKPLQVTKDFMSKYETNERENEGRLENEVAAHIRSLRNLRKQIEKREMMKARKAKYRSAQKQLELEREQLLLGKLHNEDADPASTSSTTNLAQGSTGRGESAAVASGPGTQQTVGALNTVLGSLDKLVELEKRITSLEKSNVYDDFRFTKQGGTKSRAENASNSGGRRTVFRGRTTPDARISNNRGPAGGSTRRSRLSFSKQRTEATVEAPSQVYYSVRVNRRGRSRLPDTTSRRCGPGEVRRAGGVTGARPVEGPNARTRGAASTFLTQLPDAHQRPRGVAIRGTRGVGGVGFRSAVAEKKRVEAKRRIAGERAEVTRIARQDRIVREWMQRKKAMAATGTRRQTSSVLSGSVAISAASGRLRPRAGGAEFAPRRAKNLHLQEFRDIRAQYSKRTEKLRRDYSNRQRRGSEATAGFTVGTRTTFVARPRPAPAPSVGSSRPARISRSRVTPVRGGGARAIEAASSRRPDATSIKNKTRLWRGRDGTGGMAVGGTGLRAVRARRQQGLRATGAAGFAARNKDSGTWPRRVVGVLPHVDRTGRRPVGGGRLAG